MTYSTRALQRYREAVKSDPTVAHTVYKRLASKKERTDEEQQRFVVLREELEPIK